MKLLQNYQGFMYRFFTTAVIFLLVTGCTTHQGKTGWLRSEPDVDKSSYQGSETVKASAEAEYVLGLGPRTADLYSKAQQNLQNQPEVENPTNPLINRTVDETTQSFPFSCQNCPMIPLYYQKTVTLSGQIAKPESTRLQSDKSNLDQEQTLQTEKTRTNLMDKRKKTQGDTQLFLNTSASSSDGENSPEKMVRTASKMMKQDKLKLAKKILTRASRQFPSNAEVYFLLGKINFGNDKLNRARDNFKKATQISPESARFHHYLGLTNYKLNYHELAVRHLEWALALDSERSETKRWLKKARRRYTP